MTSPPTRLWNRSFALWLFGSAQSQFGSALSSIALSFLVLHQTGSAGQMALTLAFALGPNLLMPFAGALVDRLPLKVPLIGADLARAALQLTVAGLALHLGTLPLWLVNGVALLGGFAGIFANPASSAAFPRLVPPEMLERANGLNGSLSQGAWLLGTLIGGLMVARLGPPVAILLDGLSFLLMAGLLTLVRLPHVQVNHPRQSVWRDVQSGLRLMQRSKVLSLVPVIGLAVNAAIAPLTILTPKLMEQLGPGAAGYGLFLALESLGGVFAGALLAWLGARLPGKYTTAGGLLLLALAYLLMSIWTRYSVLLTGAALAGASFSLINIPLNTLMQRMVPAEYLGRVSSVLSTVSTLGMPLALLFVSPLVDRYAPSLFFEIAATLMLAGALAWALVARAEPVPPDLNEARPLPKLDPRSI